LSEKQKTFPLRLPEELHKWLKENVKGKTINDFLIELIEQYRASLKPKIEEETVVEEDVEKRYADVQLKLTPELKKLFEIRKAIVESKEFEAFKEDFSNMEWTLDPDSDAGAFYDKSKFSKEAKDYYSALDELAHSNYEAFCLFFTALNLQFEVERKREVWKKCNGDPDEIIFKEITRFEVYNKFPKDESVSIKLVASELGLTYNDAYNHIIPWMHKEGWSFSVER